MISPGYWQVAGDELDISAWPEDEEHSIFPEGSRDKRLLRCPTPSPHSWLTSTHRYLFKKSRKTYPDQFWSEVIGSRLSQLTGVPVPPAYAAWDSGSLECAALIEWFYGFPDSLPQGFISGGSFMKQLIKDFDHVKGKQHNFHHVMLLFRALERPTHAGEPEVRLVSPWQLDWAKILTFDALIGNTDRHQENWGLVWTRDPNQGELQLGLSPAFDNGTSFGHEHPPGHFGRFDDLRYMERYIGRGTHHLKWLIDDTSHCGHSELLLKWLEKAPHLRSSMLSVLQFEPAALDDAIMPLTDLVLPVRLSRQRARFMLRLLKARQTRLLETLQIR